ncbi:YqhV family protein [Evansella sp. AB-rgal1]|uniref:YqhV family protein n=1 Tax=Evansella sp. AB-rgal1 TaxID=3242696 RepID=UPI00359D4011
MKDWISSFEVTLLSMVALRLMSGTFEITAALLMMKFNNIERALQINAILAIVGPITLILTMTIGLVGIADKLPVTKLLIVGLGVFLILFGLKK